MSQYRALTLSSEGQLRVISTECGVSEAFSSFEIKQGLPHPEIKTFTAIWDTGASSSAISQRVVDELGLVPTGWGFSDTALGRAKVQKYGVNIILPSNVGFTSIEVSCNNMKVDVLIGMDIITKGDFSITNKKGKTLFTFQTPPSHVIDFKAEIDKYIKIRNIWMKRGNNKCPCGSGLNWDNCHGKV